MSYDLIVIGGGLSGLSLAFLAAKRGIKTRLFDAGEISDSASAGLVGALAPHMPENWNPKKQYQFESISSAGNFWKDVAEVSGLETGFKRCGRLQPIHDARLAGLAELRANAAQISWQGRFRFEYCPDQKAPFARAEYGTAFDDLSAQIFPQMAIHALATACEKLGVEISEKRAVEHFGEGEVWAGKRVLAKNIVIAGGYDGWPLLRPYLGVRFGEGTKGQAALLEIDHDWRYPMLSGDGFYLVAHAPRLLGVGSTSERYWSTRHTDHALDLLLEKLGHDIPEIGRSQIRARWAGIRPRAKRPDPLVGKIGSRIFIHAGGFKTGYSFAHKLSGDLLDHILGGALDLPEGFQPKLLTNLP